MNELEIWKKKKAESNNLRGDFPVTMEHAFIQGVDSTLALDLPVKFHLWTQEEEGQNLNIDLVNKDRWIITPDWNWLPKEMTTKQLYEYWRDNILKIE